MSEAKVEELIYKMVEINDGQSWTSIEFPDVKMTRTDLDEIIVISLDSDVPCERMGTLITHIQKVFAPRRVLIMTRPISLFKARAVYEEG